MDLIEASKAGEQVIIDHPGGGTRNCAEIYAHPQGVVFLDVGWMDPTYSGHPAHLVEGEIEGEGPWTVGESAFYIATTGAAPTPAGLLSEWAAWIQNKASAGDRANRAAGAAYARAEGFLVTE